MYSVEPVVDFILSNSFSDVTIPDEISLVEDSDTEVGNANSTVIGGTCFEDLQPFLLNAEISPVCVKGYSPVPVNKISSQVDASNTWKPKLSDLPRNFIEIQMIHQKMQLNLSKI